MKLSVSARIALIREILERLCKVEEESKSVSDQMKNFTSHIGMIIQSTTLDTEDKVKAIYGGTKWVKIEGRMLIGSSDSYEVNSTGGSTTNVIAIENLPAHTHTVGSHTHGLNSHTHSIPALSGTAANSGNHNHSIPALSGYTSTTGSHTHAIDPDGGVGFNKDITGTYYGGVLNYGSGTTKAAGDHSHTIATYASTTGDDGTHSHTVTTNTSTTGASSGSTANSTAFNSGSVGSGTALNNMPPYKAVYIWERTA